MRLDLFGIWSDYYFEINFYLPIESNSSQSEAPLVFHLPRVPIQLDVHHKDPIAEGERTTTLDDVLVLCANCHRLAHSESPPLSLDALRL